MYFRRDHLFDPAVPKKVTSEPSFYAVAPAQTCKLTDATIVFCPKLCTGNPWCACFHLLQRRTVAHQVQVPTSLVLVVSRQALAPAQQLLPPFSGRPVQTKRTSRARLSSLKPGAAGLLPSSLTTGRHLSLGTKVISSRSFQLFGRHTLGSLCVIRQSCTGSTEMCTWKRLHHSVHSHDIPFHG